MRALVVAFPLMLAACNSSPTSEAESENAIATRADDIRNEADAEVAKQVLEIDAAANAEAIGVTDASVNAQ